MTARKKTTAKKKLTSQKKNKVSDLPNRKNALTEEQARQVKGGRANWDLASGRGG